jgi:hypothetical protein
LKIDFKVSGVATTKFALVVITNFDEGNGNYDKEMALLPIAL